MVHDFQAEIDAVGNIAGVPTILDILCGATGMGFAAVARVTEDRWIACSVLDRSRFGLLPGDELKVETTICNEVRLHRGLVVINNVAEDKIWCRHHTPATYGFQSYISTPVILPDGSFFGTLCSFDPEPRILDTPAIVGMFRLFAELISFHLDAHKRLARSEARLSRELEDATLREQFIAVLGHDLRNPLASVDAGAAMLLKRPLDDQAAGIVHLIRRSVSRMAGLISDVLDFAHGRLGDGLPLVPVADQSLLPILHQVIAELRATEPGRAIEADLIITKTVDCDAGRIGQLFSNLLGNAITHGAADTPIRVRAATPDGVFELSVSNSGEPISPDAMERLFQPFFRGSVQKSREGLGLGLYIAAEIARAHGGRLEVTSTSAETRFTFRMPRLASAQVSVGR